MRWLGRVLYPALFPEDLRPLVREFYTLFYHQTPSEEQLDDAPPGPSRAGADVRRTGLRVAGALAVLALVVSSRSRSAAIRCALGDLVAARVQSKLTGDRAIARPATIQTIVFNIRGPRVLAALAIGAALAAAGAAYQSLFRNPLVSPDILGVSSGAALGAVLGIFFSLHVIAIQLLAFGFGLAAVGARLRRRERGARPRSDPRARAGGRRDRLAARRVRRAAQVPGRSVQPVAGDHVLAARQSRRRRIRATSLYLLPLVVVGLVPLALLRWRINVLSVGDEEAKALGVSAGPVRLAVIASATLITAASVAVCGVIGWVGLVIPHFARMLAGPEFSRLLPVSILLGAGFVLGVDTLARTAARIEIPLGVLTAFVGTPLFLWQLTRARRIWR